MRIVSAHARDEVLDDKLVRRTIGNWLHYATPAGVWDVSAPAIEQAETPPEHWAGNFEFRKGSRRAPLQAHFGDKTDNDAPLWGVRLSNRPECWANFKALGGEAVPMAASGQTATWAGLWRDADLRLTAAAHKVQKEIVITGRTGPRRFRFALRLAPGNTFSVVDNGLRVYDRGGAEWLHTPRAWGRDANDQPVSVTMTAGEPVTIRGRTYPTVWVELGASDHAERLLPITIDPTVTISGTTAIEDNFIVSSNPTFNNGGRTTIDCGNTPIVYNAIFRIASGSSIPGGLIQAAYLRVQRFASGGQAAAGVIAVYAIKDPNTWAEGSSNNAAESGASCWGHAKYNTQEWAGGQKGCAAFGTDHDADSSPPSFAFDAYTSGVDVLHTVGLRAAWLTAWRDGARANNGAILTVTEGASGRIFRFRSAEDANGPRVYADYVPPPGTVAYDSQSRTYHHYDHIRRG